MVAFGGGESIYKICIFSPPTEDPLTFRYQDPINAVEENSCTKHVSTLCGQMQAVLMSKWMVQIVTTVLWKIQSVTGKQVYKILKILVEVNERSNTECQTSQCI